MLSRFCQSVFHARRALLLVALLASPFALSGCFLFAASAAVAGQKVEAQYRGLADKSVAIVIYTDQATTNEFPAAREELSSFIAAQLREHVPTAKLLDPREVINWQDDTLNWFGLSEKEIGKHFSVDRVLYIELLDYSVSENRGFGDLQGHLRANCKVYEVDAPGETPAWTSLVDVSFPTDRPLDPSQTSPDAIRARTLQRFTEQLINSFYDHQKFEQPLKDRD